MKELRTESELILSCAALLPGVRLTPGEQRLVDEARGNAVKSSDLKALRVAIQRGGDPLGESFALIRSAAIRRVAGAVYTPMPIVESMLRWIASKQAPDRVVDPGAGSGRFILAAGKLFPDAKLIAIEMDPVAALMLRANVHTSGLADRTKIVVGDYREAKLPKIKGVTAFIGNPPYVRHHDIDDTWKSWYVREFAALGIKASALAGLHLHFFLQTRLLAKRGDIGAFITSSEWIDVNYGSSLRNLLVNELGGLALHVLEPTVEAFPGTQSTAAITCFRLGETDAPVRVRSVDTLPRLNGLTTGTDIPRAKLEASPKWSIIVKPPGDIHQGGIELGELFRVHRGQVTGANGIWIAGARAEQLPSSVLIPAVTKARELIEAGERLRNATALRRIVDIPADLDMFARADRQRINSFLQWAKEQGGDQSYIARHRKAWWSVGLKDAAPILCTYMARRPPQFTVNGCNARHINIAHGLYPREELPADVIVRIVSWLNQNINVAAGRTYAGGLTKFEPKEMERLRIPALERFIA